MQHCISINTLTLWCRVILLFGFFKFSKTWKNGGMQQKLGCKTALFICSIFNAKRKDVLFFPRVPYLFWQLQYNSPGALDLEKRVKELLKNSGFKTVKEDT